MAKQETTESKVAKTVKLFIGGDFPRTESGRSFPIFNRKTKKLFAHVCQASRKDFRNAVTAAAAAQHGWQTRSAYNRGQILYRMAEMAESKRGEFVEILVATLGLTPAQADKSVSAAVSAFVYYAGFSDKYQQLIGAVNPVSGPHHNFTTAEPVGVVGLICADKFDLAQVCAEIASIICSGNALVTLLSEEGSALITPLAEVFSTSDLPKGVINLLTGKTSELYKQFGTHMEVHSLSCSKKDAKMLAELKIDAAENMKRVVPFTGELQSLEKLLGYVEYKTVWHPVGH